MRRQGLSATIRMLVAESLRLSTRQEADPAILEPACWHRSIAACGGSVRPSSKRGRNPGSAGTRRAVGQPGQEVDGAPGLYLPAPAACCIADTARRVLPNAPNQNARPLPRVAPAVGLPGGNIRASRSRV